MTLEEAVLIAECIERQGAYSEMSKAARELYREIKRRDAVAADRAKRLNEALGANEK